MDAIPDGIPVLMDVKRGDIGSTAAAYAEACYDEGHGLKADGVTLSPLMGWDSVQPFVTGEFVVLECDCDFILPVCVCCVCFMGGCVLLDLMAGVDS